MKPTYFAAYQRYVMALLVIKYLRSVKSEQIGFDYLKSSKNNIRLRRPDIFLYSTNFSFFLIFELN